VSSIAVGAEPAYAAYDWFNGYVYVSNEGSNTVSVINGTTVIATIDVGTSPTLPVEGSRNGGEDLVYVPDSGSANVSVISGTTLLANVSVGSDPQFVSFNNNSDCAYVSNDGSASVSVLCGTTNVVSPALSVGALPQAGVWDQQANPPPGWTYVSCQNSPFSGSEALISGVNVFGSVPLGVDPRSALLVASGYVYVPISGGGQVSVISGMKVISNLTVGQDPWSAADDGGTVYVVNHGSDNVTELNGLSWVGTIAVGAAPTYAVADSETQDLYVVNSGSDNVSVLAGTTVVGTVNVGSDPGEPAFDPANGYLYVPNEGSDNVSVIPSAYPVTFTERGLPNGTGWWVNATFGGPSSTFSNTSTLTFNESDGPHAYSVDSDNKVYGAAGGRFTVPGRAVSEAVNFTLATYPVTFTETNLPIGTPWWVNVSGRPPASTATANLSFQEYYGTYSYTVSTTNKTFTAPGGTLSVLGWPVTIGLHFSPTTYKVTFTETGLPRGSYWWVRPDGNPVTASTTTNLSIYLYYGAYNYTVSTTDKTYASPAGSFTLGGSPTSVTAVFTRVTYAVTFAEVGLPSGTEWWLEVGGSPTEPTTGTTLSIVAWNGTYPYTALTTNRSWAASGGSLTVNGTAVSRGVTFARVTYTVTFMEEGLSAGTSWSVLLDGVTQSSGSSRIVFPGEPNGTATFTIGGGMGYTASPNVGSITVGGHPLTEQIVFTPASRPPSPSFLGLPWPEAYAVLGAVIAIGLVGVTLAALRRRKRRAPPEAEALIG
jgi:YVTN family beta-propeller protein